MSTMFFIQFAIVLLCILIGAQVGGIGLGVLGGIGLAVLYCLLVSICSRPALRLM